MPSRKEQIEAAKAGLARLDPPVTDDDLAERFVAVYREVHALEPEPALPVSPEQPIAPEGEQRWSPTGLFIRVPPGPEATALEEEALRLAGVEFVDPPPQEEQT